MSGEKRRPQTTPHQLPAKVATSDSNAGTALDAVDVAGVVGADMTPDAVLAMTAPHVPVIGLDLLSATRRELDVFDAGWFWGYRAGVEAGRRQCADENEAAWRTMADRVRRMATASVPFSVLCARRREHDRAERAREHERRLGVRA